MVATYIAHRSAKTEELAGMQKAPSPNKILVDGGEE